MKLEVSLAESCYGCLEVFRAWALLQAICVWIAHGCGEYSRRCGHYCGPCAQTLVGTCSVPDRNLHVLRLSSCGCRWAGAQRYSPTRPTRKQLGLAGMRGRVFALQSTLVRLSVELAWPWEEYMVLGLLEED